MNSGSLTDPVERAIAAIATAVYWGTAAWYTKEGDGATAGLLVAAGGVQGWAAFMQ
jgi:hypothetical protein